MKNIIVASKNPVKLQATLCGFQKMFPGEIFTVTGFDVASDVSDQPMSSDETLQGALNRARGARLAEPSGDYFVGIEGGVEIESDQDMSCFAWVVILDGMHTQGKSCTSTFIYPDK